MKNQTKQYYISYEHNEDGGYIASAPAIPGCTVYGETIKEAYINIQNAIQECLEVIKEFKKSPPKETINPEMVKRISFVTPREYVKT
ncbi:MAG TPA: type II toxin-antitoxin system HicB family antitoxin [Candidatus Paceibacterota bacterium]